MLKYIVHWPLSELKRCKGRFRLLKLSVFPLHSGGRLVFASSRVGCEKRYVKREMPVSGKGLSMFWNLLESSSTVCPQTFESSPCFRSQNPKLACQSKFIKFLPSSEFTARAHNSRNTLIFFMIQKRKKKQ